MRTRVIYPFLPLFLGILFAVLWYPPDFNQLVGWGEDPYFNLWTLEQVWKNLSSLGIFKIFSDEFWKTPIFYPFPNTLAFSENQIMVGLLSWPIRILSHNGVFTYNLMALLMSLATFFFSWLWLDSIGVKKFALWGGLLFQACGWIQDQYAHFQNICIFIFPLALYSWSSVTRKPSYPRAFLCAFCFGWVIGWNVYYQIFLNLIFALLLTKAFIKNELPKASLFFIAVTTLLVEMPFAYKYLELESLMGSLKVPSGEFLNYSASPLSILAHGNSISFLQKFLPFYPKIQLSLESVGFLGLTWTALTFFALRNPKARIFSLIALFFFWVALGPHFGLMTLVKLFPGFHGARAIGRIQVLVALFSLGAILIYLETLKPRVQVLLMAFIVLELVPSELSKHVPVLAGLYDGKATELELRLAHLSPTDPLLILPELKSQFQLSLSRTNNSFLGGYSGRTPLNAHLLTQLGKEGTTPERLKQQLYFSKAKYVVSVDSSLSESLKGYPFLTLQGCYTHFDVHPCLFSPAWRTPEDLNRLNQPSLNLELDTDWTYPLMAKGHKAILKVHKSGILDYKSTGKCWIEEKVYLGALKVWTSKRALLGHGFKGAELLAGDELIEEVSKQWIYSLPMSFRPNKTYSLVCHSNTSRS